MWRVLLEPALLFLSPFALYAATFLLRRTPPFAGYYWSRGTLSWLSLAGMAVAVAGMFLFGILAERHSGAYVPAHIENGKLVPGRLE